MSNAYNPEAGQWETCEYFGETQFAQKFEGREILVTVCGGMTFDGVLVHSCGPHGMQLRQDFKEVGHPPWEHSRIITINQNAVVAITVTEDKDEPIRGRESTEVPLGL